LKDFCFKCVFFCGETKKSYTYVAGQPYQDEIRQLLIKIVLKKYPRTPSKKSLVDLGIRTLFKNEFAIGKSHQVLLISGGEKIGVKKKNVFLTR
jgi:hypothetical protein